MISRRYLLLSAIFGAGYIGLRSLATGLPVSFLSNPRKALADRSKKAGATSDKAQYIIMSTSGDGDSINASVPGTYDDPMIVHSVDPAMAAKMLRIRGKSHV